MWYCSNVSLVVSKLIPSVEHKISRIKLYLTRKEKIKNNYYS